MSFRRRQGIISLLRLKKARFLATLGMTIRGMLFRTNVSYMSFRTHVRNLSKIKYATSP